MVTIYTSQCNMLSALWAIACTRGWLRHTTRECYINPKYNKSCSAPTFRYINWFTVMYTEHYYWCYTFLTMHNMEIKPHFGTFLLYGFMQ